MCIRDRADMLHIIHHFGGVENLKGKKIAMTWAYSPSYGKPLSLIHISARPVQIGPELGGGHAHRLACDQGLAGTGGGA